MAVERLIGIMEKLRNPVGGCAWDLEQDFESIAPYTIEEAYEVEDAIRRRDWPALCDELGDLLLQVVFHSQMAREAGHFAFDDVVDAVCDKLVRRHPNVFGDAVVESAGAQVEAWEAQKARERAARGEHEIGDGVPLALPALSRARKLISRARRAGRGPAEPADPEAPIAAEVGALDEALASGDAARIAPQLGGLLFALAALAQRVGVDPEDALRTASARFEGEVRDPLPSENAG